MDRWRGLGIVSLVFLAGCLSEPLGEREPSAGARNDQEASSSSSDTAGESPGDPSPSAVPSPNGTYFVNHSDDIVLVDREYTYTNPLLSIPSLLPVVGEQTVALLVEFDVDPDMRILRAGVSRYNEPRIEPVKPLARFTNPSGESVDHNFSAGSAGFAMENPMAGRWRLEYVVEPTEPGFEHELVVLVIETTKVFPHEYTQQDDPAPSASLLIVALFAVVAWKRR